ncbi:methyl-accepting chemotaxis protein [Paucibacter sp. M5-1]|uniref:methyl-accepting chemotaxis protein n=1 Tax=Paucibacter sp. M5-1 TaxID=3015998 RepID=UPI0022B8FE8C|nr:methyl-accepting chemotaxis protein [Paucibacter sp. M5-1]MCZ7879490.1 Cache 3/Cache 2 fusion domain-containing protein [Paucibacter sp. M5-1]
MRIDNSDPRASTLGYASVARRVSLISCLGIATLLIAICTLISWLLTEQARQRSVDYMASEAAAVARVADALDRTARQSADRLYAVLAAELTGSFALQGEAELTHEGQALAGELGLVDRFSAKTGGVATIFARKGEDFMRVTTSLTKQDGSRAMGTLLGSQHPAFAKMMAGGSYVGPATLFGVPFMTRYQAIKDAQGQVVGILFVGFDMRGLQQELVAMAQAVKLYESGGLYIIDPAKSAADAYLRAHPSAQGKKLAELLPGGAEGLLKALAEAPKGLLSEAPALYNDKHDDAFAVAQRSEGTGWWVVAEASQSTALAAHYRSLQALWGLMMLAVLVLGLGITALLRRWVGQPLEALNGAVQAIADGDLTQPVGVARRDDIGALATGVETMRQQLAGTIAEVSRASDQIGLASAEVAAGSRDLSQRTEQSASRLQETAGAMEELSGSMSQTAAAAEQAHQFVGASDQAAEHGGQVVAQVVQTMEQIRGASAQIAEITGTIDSIAFQTNILALNAAVEAARAGEQGRGFAVVASEVRVLAQRSAEAAKQIRSLISSSGEKVESGARLVGEAGTAMQEILGSVKRVAGIIGEISTAAREQAIGVGQINAAVADLDQGTQQNAALVEQSTAAAESLQEQADKLVQQVGRFRV